MATNTAGGLIPADFGSVDSSSPLTQELVPLYVHKSRLRDYLMQLASKHPDFTWTSLVCGHFFDWSLEFLHIWLAERKADRLDDGEIKWSTSTLSQIGEATARILKRPDITKNRMIYVQSFLVSQNQVIEAFERATSSKFQITNYDSKTYQAEEKKKAEAGDLDAIENLVWLLGAIDANWEKKDNFAMLELGLSEENLDEVVRKIVAKEEQK